MPTDFFAEHLTQLPVIGIFRGATPDRAVQLANNAWDVGVELVEVTVETPATFASLHAVIQAGNARGATVGAGSVTTAEQVHRVADAGAAFIVSPGLHPAVVETSLHVGIPVIPGVATATEIAAAAGYGLTWVKAFPAAQLTPAWITAQLGPFPGMRFAATGGVTAANAGEFLRAGCSAVATSSAFTSAETARSFRDAITHHER